MNHFDLALATRAFRAGRAVRNSCYRHRRLLPAPLAIVLWQLGAEPFSASAIGWGNRFDSLEMTVAGEPRNRDLAFRSLLPFARWFNPHFEAFAADREKVARGTAVVTRAKTAPQVLVANTATVEMLGRLGRRLAYLPRTGPTPADEALVRLGRHLSFLWDHWAVPGQQLLISLTDLLISHWATLQSDLERQSLAALDAWIEPPDGMHGFAAAAVAEDRSVGPVPPGECDQRLEPLVERFNELRADSTDPAIVLPLLEPINEHYRPLVMDAWDLLWRCRDREAEFSEARSVGRRWDEDREAYTRHIDWLARGGLRRTRQTARQAAMTLRNLEEAQTLLDAEEACDDPLRMAPYILAHKAVQGRVVGVDLAHKEKLTRMVRRPLVTIHSLDPCVMPTGKLLYWTEEPAGREFMVHKVEPAPGGGFLVTLKLMTSSAATRLPSLDCEACFSIHKTATAWSAILPWKDPWTHLPARPAAGVGSIDD